MSLKVVDGDLLEMAANGMFDMIIHGANCFCVMGAGIADQIRRKYPDAYLADLKTIKGDRSKLGHYSWVKVDNKVGGSFIIVNGYTQYNLSTGGEDVLDYDALNNIIHLVKQDFKGMRLGFPLIGCGYAHGDEKRVVANITQVLKDEDITIVRYK